MKPLLPVATIMLGLFFSAAIAAKGLPVLIDRQSSGSEEIMGKVSVRGVNGSSDDAVKQLRQKGATMGGSKLRIVSLSTPGDSSQWMGNAVVYR